MLHERAACAPVRVHTHTYTHAHVSLVPFPLSSSPLRPDLLRERTRFADTDLLHPSKITDRDAADRRVGASPGASATAAAAGGECLAGARCTSFRCTRAGYLGRFGAPRPKYPPPAVEGLARISDEGTTEFLRRTVDPLDSYRVIFNISHARRVSPTDCERKICGI